jgi:hypothetical protein
MSQVVAGICTSAMIKLGAEPIEDLQEDSKEARLCRIQYPKIRDAVLRSAPWSFAIKRVQLSPSNTNLLFGDQNVFQLPQDCVKFLKLYDNRPHSRYTIEGDNLMTNLETVEGWYISNAIEPEKYDPSFKEALASWLAADLCYSLTQSNNLKQELLTTGTMIMGEARSYNSQEVTPEDFQFDEFLDARRGGRALYGEPDFF